MTTFKMKPIAALILALAFAGCGQEQMTKNMEQIYAEEGVPVSVIAVTPGGFSSELEYNAVLSGLKESSAYALVDDKVERVNYKVGDFVEKDAVVLAFPTDNPSAHFFQAKVTFENARATFERMQNYFESGGLSRQDFDNAAAAYEVARADWEAVQQSVLVRAPISGVLTRINVRESENVSKEDELFVVSQIDRLKARIWVSDKEILQLEKGQKTSALWNGVTLEGHVVQVDLSMNRDRQAFGVVVEFQNPDMNVRYGVTAQVKISTYQDLEAISIERKNVIKAGNAWHVFVADSGVARQRKVELGRSDGLMVEIVSGLEPGEMLITEGQMHLDDGTRIRLIDSGLRAAAN